MKDYCYRKKYPFEKSVFIQKFMARTVPFDECKSRWIPLGRSLEGRVFVGEIKGNNFKVATCPGMWDAVRHPLPGIRNIPVWRNPSCIYGSIQECGKYVIVDYTVDIMRTSRFVSGQGIIIGSIGLGVCIMGAYVEGIYWGTVIGIVIFMLHIVSSVSALQSHQSEHGALVKFMEDLEN